MSPNVIELVEAFRNIQITKPVLKELLGDLPRLRELLKKLYRMYPTIFHPDVNTSETAPLLISSILRAYGELNSATNADLTEAARYYLEDSQSEAGTNGLKMELMTMERRLEGDRGARALLEQQHAHKIQVLTSKHAHERQILLNAGRALLAVVGLREPIQGFLTPHTAHHYLMAGELTSKGESIEIIRDPKILKPHMRPKLKTRIVSALAADLYYIDGNGYLLNRKHDRVFEPSILISKARDKFADLLPHYQEKYRTEGSINTWGWKQRGIVVGFINHDKACVLRGSPTQYDLLGKPLTEIQAISFCGNYVQPHIELSDVSGFEIITLNVVQQESPLTYVINAFRTTASLFPATYLG